MSSRGPVVRGARIWLLVFIALALGCEQIGADRLELVERGLSPAIGDRAEFSVGELRVAIERSVLVESGVGLTRVFDVRVENRSAESRPGCVRVEARGRGFAVEGARIGLGTLEPDAVGFHPAALVIDRFRSDPVRENELRWSTVETPDCPRAPNVVVILADDLGYADVSALGNMAPSTPHIDRLAREGLTLADFYAAPSCTPARAELMTGSYARRVGVPTFYGPFSTRGLHPDEITIAELVAPYGYRSAHVGKWHLGSAPPFRPTAQGFDEFFGVLYSHDLTNDENPFFPSLRLYEGDVVAEVAPPIENLTDRFTTRAEQFIADNRDGPFLLYLAHVMPHVPLAPSAGFEGASGLGPYADVLLEVDDSVGRVLDALDRAGIADETIVLFASDNGPWLRYGNHAGLATPFREGKLTSFEGGVRVPAFLRWPDRIPTARRIENVTGLIDVWPTLARVVGAPPPTDRRIDGRSLLELIEPAAPGLLSARDLQIHHFEGQLRAVRFGDAKLVVPHTYQGVVAAGADGSPGVIEVRSVDEVALYRLDTDPGELTNVADSEPALVELMWALADEARLDLGDDVLGIPGQGLRPEGGASP